MSDSRFQADKFRNLARELASNEDEPRFEEAAHEMVQAPKSARAAISQMRSLIIVAAAAMLIPIEALAQGDDSPSDTSEGEVLMECISRQARMLYRAPDTASEVAQAVVAGCETKRRAMVAKLSAMKATATEVEEFEGYVLRRAQYWVIFERAARATVRE